MQIRLLMTDLDGTLLTSDKSLSEANRAALERCAARGIEIVPATGRFYRAIPQAVRELDFVNYVVSVNGAEIRRNKTGEVLHRDEIPLPLAMKIYDELERLPSTHECYLDDWGYMPRRFYEKIERYVADPLVRDMVRRLRTPVDDFRAFLREKNHALQKIQMFFPDEAERRRQLTRLQALFPETAVTSSVAGSIEMTSRTATKARALLRLCGLLQIDPAQTVAFGDSSNDRTMIETAGIGVAMQNADESVRAAADFVTGTNDSDGVASAIFRLGLV